MKITRAFIRALCFITLALGGYELARADVMMDWPHAKNSASPRFDRGWDSPAMVQFGQMDKDICYLVITRGQKEAALVLSASNTIRGHIDTKEGPQPPPTKELNAIEVNNGKIVARKKISLSYERFWAVLENKDRLTLDSFGDLRGKGPLKPDK